MRPHVNSILCASRRWRLPPHRDDRHDRRPVPSLRPCRHFPAQPHRDGADDPCPQPRSGRQRTHRAVLPAARQRRPDHQRRHACLAAGPGLHRRAGHLVGRAGGRVEACHRGGACRTGHDLRPALARRPHVAFLAAARRWATGQRRYPPGGQRTEEHLVRVPGRWQPRPRRSHSGTCTGDCGDPRYRRRLRARGGQRHCGRLRRHRTACRQRLPVRAVPQPAHQPA